MGLFGGIGKTLGNVVKNTFKAPADLLGGKVTLGNIANTALMFSGGGGLKGINSVKDLSKLGTKNLFTGKGVLGGYDQLYRSALKGDPAAIATLSQLFSENKSADGTFKMPSGDQNVASSDPVKVSNQLLAGLSQTALNDLKFKQSQRPQFYNTITQAIADLDPATNATRAIRAGNAASQDALLAAEQEARRLSNSGYSSAVTDGLLADAQKQSVDYRNSALERVMDPEFIAQQRRAQLAMMSNDDIEQSLGQALQAAGINYDMKAQQSAANAARQTWQKTAASLLGEAAAGMTDDDWTNVLAQVRQLIAPSKRPKQTPAFNPGAGYSSQRSRPEDKPAANKVYGIDINALLQAVQKL